MIQINKEQVKNQTILDIKLEENELSEDDLDEVSGGYPGNSDYEIVKEHENKLRDDYKISTLSGINHIDDLTGTRTYTNGKTVS